MRGELASISMTALKAHVENGRIIVDEPTDLPDGTQLYVVAVDEEIQDRLDIVEANRVVSQMKATGEQPIRIGELKRQLGLWALMYMLEAEPKDELTHAYDSAFADDTRDPLTSETTRTVLAGIEWSDE
jgi:hypothetical protein